MELKIDNKIELVLSATITREGAVTLNTTNYRINWTYSKHYGYEYTCKALVEDRLLSVLPHVLDKYPHSGFLGFDVAGNEIQRLDTLSDIQVLKLKHQLEMTKDFKVPTYYTLGDTDARYLYHRTYDKFVMVLYTPDVIGELTHVSCEACEEELESGYVITFEKDYDAETVHGLKLYLKGMVTDRSKLAEHLSIVFDVLFNMTKTTHINLGLLVTNIKKYIGDIEEVEVNQWVKRKES